LHCKFDKTWAVIFCPALLARGLRFCKSYYALPPHCPALFYRISAEAYLLTGGGYCCIAMFFLARGFTHPDYASLVDPLFRCAGKRVGNYCYCYYYCYYYFSQPSLQISATFFK